MSGPTERGRTPLNETERDEPSPDTAERLGFLDLTDWQAAALGKILHNLTRPTPADGQDGPPWIHSLDAPRCENEDCCTDDGPCDCACHRPQPTHTIAGWEPSHVILDEIQDFQQEHAETAPRLSPVVEAAVLRAAADAGVPVEAPPRSGAEFDRLWTAARISTPAAELDDETWLAREQLKAYILEHKLTGGWLEDIVFGPVVSLVQPYTVLRDAPRRRRR